MSALLARRTWFVYLAMLASLVSGRISQAASDEAMFASLRLGALQFQHRCAICHGSDGLGEGPLPMLIANYPNTNLMLPRVATDSTTIRRVIVEGPMFADTSTFMPPWGDALAPIEIDALTLFVVYLRQDLNGAIQLSRDAAKQIPPSTRIGRGIFIGRCALCHGHDGTGSGRMAIRLNPKPSNLVLSRETPQYLRRIITEGGTAMQRSPAMPAWRGELNELEIESILLHIDSLRKKTPGQ